MCGIYVQIHAATGAGRGIDNILEITLGTGIGASMLHGNEPVPGADGHRPEAGQRERILTSTVPPPTIVGADVGQYGGAIGAAALAHAGHSL